MVIVTHNSAQVIDDLLDTLPDALAWHSAEWVVVDNGSTDETAAIVGARSEVTLLRCQNRGYAAGINSGIAALPRTEAILVLNPDVRLAAGCVATMLRTLRSARAGIVVPRILDVDGQVYPSLRRAPTLLRGAGLGFTGWPALAEMVTDRSQYELAHVVDWASGAVLLISRQCQEEVGLWDESFFLYSEETDYSLRAADQGWVTCYDPAAVATHIGGGSGRNEKTHSMLVINRVRLYARRHGLISSWAYFVLTVLSQLSWLIRGNKHSRASITALLKPSRRPPELACSKSVLPR